MKIRTPRLMLRLVETGDVDHWLAMNEQPGVLRFISNHAPTRDEVEASIARIISRGRLHHGYGFWSAFEADGSFVGWFHLRPGGPEQDDLFDPELGYRLRTEYWGQGLATEGSRAFLEYAFTQLGAASVHAETMAVNTGSRRVMEKLGMTLAESFEMDLPDHVPGSEHGEVRYRVGVADWLERNPSPRDQLRDLQQAALVAHRGGVPGAADTLDQLRAVGMELARIEVDDTWASADLVRRLATRAGLELS